MSTTTTKTNVRTDDSDDDLEESRLIDYDGLFDEWIDCEDDEDDDNDDNYVPVIADEDESDAYSDSSSEDDDLSIPVQSQQDRQTQDENEEEELEQILSDLDELKNKTSSLLKKVRKLIKMINKSSILATFVRNEIQRKQIALNAAINPSNEEKIKINDLVNDFHIRWNSTYLTCNHHVFNKKSYLIKQGIKRFVNISTLDVICSKIF